MNTIKNSIALAAASMLLAQTSIAQIKTPFGVAAGYLGTSRVDSGVAYVKDKAAYGAILGMQRPFGSYALGLSVAGHNIDNGNTTADQQIVVSSGIMSPVGSPNSFKWAAGIARQLPNGDLSNYTEGGVRAGKKFGNYTVAGSIIYTDNGWGVADNTWKYSLGSGMKISSFDVAATLYTVDSQSGNSSNLLGDNKWSGLLLKTAFNFPKLAKIGIAYDINDASATPDSGMLVATVGLGQFFGGDSKTDLYASPDTARVGLASTTAF